MSVTTEALVPRAGDVPSLDDRLDRIERRLDALVDHAARQERDLEPVRDLLAEVGVLSGPLVAGVTARVAALDERGYLDFARSSVQVADRIVTSFDEDDVAALGDNVVLMLETLRDLTQPEVLRLLRQTAGTVGDAAEAAEGPPPSIPSLLRQLRDPHVRRGVARLLEVVRGIGDDTTAT